MDSMILKLFGSTPGLNMEMTMTEYYFLADRDERTMTAVR